MRSVMGCLPISILGSSSGWTAGAHATDTLHSANCCQPLVRLQQRHRLQQLRRVQQRCGGHRHDAHGLGRGPIEHAIAVQERAVATIAG